MMTAYWAIIGSIYLIVLTVQDYKHFMNIDDRFNFFMTGLSISLISHVQRSFWYMLGLIAAILIINFLMKKFKIWGEGDINTISWIFLGFGIVHFTYVAYFFIIFSVVAGLYYLLKYLLFRYKKPTQFYPVILISFIITATIFKFYTNML